MSVTTASAEQFRPGSLVAARGREWVVLPGAGDANLLRLRPLGGAEDDATIIYLPLEAETPRPASFPPPDPNKTGAQTAALLLRDALLLKLRAGAGPFRSFGNIAVEPRAYQLVPLLMALKMDVIRLLIADDVGIGKTVEGGLIARELLDRGEISRVAVLCPPHLCDQWQEELAVQVWYSDRDCSHRNSRSPRTRVAARPVDLRCVSLHGHLTRLHQIRPAPSRVPARLPGVRDYRRSPCLGRHGR